MSRVSAQRGLVPARSCGLAERYGATFGVVECVCPDIAVHRSRLEGRRRDIPGWYELDRDRVVQGRQAYEPLRGPKVVIDVADRLDDNVSLALAHLAEMRLPDSG